MKFDDITILLGEFGRYQKILYCIICIPVIFNAFNVMIVVFTLALPDFRCQIPGLENDTFELQGKWHAYQINQTIPISEEVNSNAYDTCHVYSPGENNTKIECNSWVYDQSTFQDTFITKFNLVCGLELARANANMLVMAGMLTGSAVVGIFADMFGRKRAFLCTEVLLVAAMFGTAFSPNYQVLDASRFLAGFGHNTFLPVFSMAMELVGPSYRVAAGIFVELFWCVGLFILCLLAYFVRSATNLTLVVGAPMILVFLYIWLIPESPRWLISKGKNKEAYKIIQKIAKKNKITLPENVIDEHSVESGKSMSVIKMFTIPKLLIRTLIIYLNWAVINMVYFGLGLNVGNLGGNIYVNFAINSAMETAAYLLCLVSLDRVGRKILHSGSMILGGVACLLTIFSTLYGGTSLHWLTIALANIGKFGISAGFAIVYIWTAELFPTPVRNSGIGSSCMVGRLGSIICPYITDLGRFVPGQFGQALPLIVFGGLSVVAGLLSLYLPETNGVHLPETIQDAVNFGAKNERHALKDAKEKASLV